MYKRSYSRPLKNLREMRGALKEEQMRLTREIASLDKVIRQLEAIQEVDPDLKGASNGDHELPEITAGDIEGLSHAAAARLILSRMPAPLTTRQLLETFERAGRPLSAKNGYGILSKTLKKHRHFQYVAGRWQLVENGG